MTTTPNPAAAEGGVSVLERAEELLARGDVLQAIDVLSAAQAADPGPEVAHRIVALRHQAATQASREPGRPSWPPVFEDPFPDVVGIPEIADGRLTTEILGGSILHHGALIVRGFLDRERALDLHSRVVAALDDRDTLEDKTKAGDGGGRYRPFDTVAPSVPAERAWVRQVGGMLMADAPEIMVELLGIFAGSGAAEAITGYLGERPALSYNKCVLRRLVESHPTWHQDGAFMGSDIRAVDIWLSLSRCGGDAAAPGLDLVPKRIDDLLETGTKGSIFPNSIGPGVIEEVSTDAPPQTPLFEPGDAIIFDDRFVHRSSAERTFTEERYAVESWFFAPSRFPEGYVPILV
jgi:hypothetical protein